MNLPSCGSGHLFATLALGLGLLMPACSKNAFSSLTKINGDKEKSEPSNTSTPPDESDSVDEPVMTGGAFLVCARDRDIVQDIVKDGLVGLGMGCRMEDENRKKLNLSTSLQWQTAITLAGNDTEVAPIKPTEDKVSQLDQLYHWHVWVKETQQEMVNFRVIFNKENFEDARYYARLPVFNLLKLNGKEAAGGFHIGPNPTFEFEDPDAGYLLEVEEAVTEVNYNSSCIGDKAANEYLDGVVVLDHEIRKGTLSTGNKEAVFNFLADNRGITINRLRVGNACGIDNAAGVKVVLLSDNDEELVSFVLKDRGLPVNPANNIDEVLNLEIPAGSGFKLRVLGHAKDHFIVHDLFIEITGTMTVLGIPY